MSRATGTNTVFTGVSGSGRSSLGFGTIAAESRRLPGSSSRTHPPTSAARSTLTGEHLAAYVGI